MSNVKYLWVMLTVGLAGFMADGAIGTQQSDISMLVVPARYSVMQVAFDMIDRFPIVLVSYQGDAATENPVLHAWNGHEWVLVSVRDYSEGNFLQITPRRTVLVGGDQLLPPVMGQVTAWCPKVDRINEIDTASLVNGLAASYSFKPADWRWFAKRFNLRLTDENAPARASSWYDNPSEDVTPAPAPKSERKPFQLRLDTSIKPAAPRPVREELPAADVVQPVMRMDEMEPIPAPQSIDMEPAMEPIEPTHGSTLPPASFQDPAPDEPISNEADTIRPIHEEAEPAVDQTPIKPIGWEEKAVAPEMSTE